MNNMGKFLILSVADHEEHILNKIIEAIANEPELDHIALPPSNASLSFPDLEIRLKEQTVSCNGQLVTLTHHEFAVLAYLARHPDWVFSASRSTRPYGIGTANTAVLPLPASSVDPAQADAGHTKSGLYPYCTGQRI